MSKYSVVVSARAEADLRSIYDYIAGERGEPENARALIVRINEAISLLDTFPERFRRYEVEPFRSEGLRVMPLGNYLIFYIADPVCSIVSIARVIYGPRDIPAALSDTPEP